MKTNKHVIGTVLQWFFILGAYAFVLMITYNADSRWTFYLALAAIPMFFFCWGLSILLSGKTVREISKHLTDEERAKASRLAGTYGGVIGIFLFVACFIMYSLWPAPSSGNRSILSHVCIVSVALVLAAPFIFRQRKKMKAFMISTEYAKACGYDKDFTNQRQNAKEDSLRNPPDSRP